MLLTPACEPWNPISMLRVFAAESRKRKAAVKLHTLLDLCGNNPTLFIITPGRVRGINILDDLVFHSNREPSM